MNARFPAFLLWLALTLSAFAAWPSESAPPRVPNQVHLAGIACGVPGKPACLSCVSCHDVATHDSGQRMPQAAVCERCHRDAHQVKAVLTTVPVRPSGEIWIDHDK